MRIVFFPFDCCPFHGKTLEERPLGGTETAIIQLSEALADTGHEVFVVSSMKHVPAGHPIYLTPSMAKHLEDIDILIVTRGLPGVLSNQMQKTFFLDRRYLDQSTYFWHRGQAVFR